MRRAIPVIINVLGFEVFSMVIREPCVFSLYCLIILTVCTCDLSVTLITYTPLFSV